MTFTGNFVISPRNETRIPNSHAGWKLGYEGNRRMREFPALITVEAATPAKS